jgi:hypothetical protein
LTQKKLGADKKNEKSKKELTFTKENHQTGIKKLNLVTLKSKSAGAKS